LSKTLKVGNKINLSFILGKPADWVNCRKFSLLRRTFFTEDLASIINKLDEICEKKNKLTEILRSKSAGDLKLKQKSNFPTCWWKSNCSTSHTPLWYDEYGNIFRSKFQLGLKRGGRGHQYIQHLKYKSIDTSKIAYQFYIIFFIKLDLKSIIISNAHFICFHNTCGPLALFYNQQTACCAKIQLRNTYRQFFTVRRISLEIIIWKFLYFSSWKIWDLETLYFFPFIVPHFMVRNQIAQQILKSCSFVEAIRETCNFNPFWIKVLYFVEFGLNWVAYDYFYLGKGGGE